mgnify:CR=1 FL=1
MTVFIMLSIKVAPARERGLKWYAWHDGSFLSGRSREGAWIEMDFALYYLGEFESLPRGSVD